MGIKVAFITGPEENMGIKYLSAVLKAGGHDAELFFDPQLFDDEIASVRPLSRMFSRKGDLVKRVLHYQPRLLAFSVTTDFYGWALDLAHAFKRVSTIPVIFGGIHPTSLPEEVLRSDAVDMVCIGEGELALRDLADSLASGAPRSDIQNIWFKADGKIIRNPLRPLVDLDTLPNPDHDLYYKKGIIFRSGYHTMASRGCFYCCSYCCHSTLRNLYPQAHYYRVRSVENLIRELAVCKSRYRIRVIRFHDDIFPSDINWLNEFKKAYTRQIRLPFICYLHPQLADEERVSLLGSSGCREIRLGIQSLNPRIRKEVLNREESNETISRAIRAVKSRNMNVITENMLGLPGQNDDDVIELLKFYNENRPTRNHFFWLRYYPGVALSRPDDQGESKKPRRADVFTRGGDTFHTLNPHLVMLLYLQPLLPPAFVAGIIEKRSWEHLPVFPLPALNIFANLTSRTYCDMISRRRALYRYLFF